MIPRSFPTTAEAIRSYASIQGVTISDLFGRFIPHISRHEHAAFSHLVNNALVWDDWRQLLFPKDDFRVILFAAMAADSHFTATEADTINKSIPPRGIRTCELFDLFLGPSLEYEKHGACVVLWMSILHFDEETELYFARQTTAPASTLPTAEEIRDRVPPKGLSITDLFDHFLPRVPSEEHPTFVLQAKKTLRYYKEMQLLFRKSDINEEPGPTRLPTTELILSQIPKDGISPEDFERCFVIEKADGQAFVELVKRVAVYDEDTKMIFPHDRFILDKELAHAVGNRCRICKLTDSIFADCV